ncbi:MAG: hypothetical protein RID09_16880 [Coleofasciculus sp. G1-WW12-02]|uniref:hypothetical protein n=1 Tax=Coleofasciculus sp. G1-WW12-02 TaxID=3068483 RepID=UPI0032F5B690
MTNDQCLITKYRVNLNDVSLYIGYRGRRVNLDYLGVSLDPSAYHERERSRPLSIARYYRPLTESLSV